MKWLMAAAAMLLATQQTDTPEEQEGLPLEATATIELTTDEVTRMSPDGSTVVFDLLGDLYTLPITGGEAIGLSADVGSLEVGKLADILVLDRNPLENIENTNTVRYVMKNGELFEAATLDQIWPELKRLPDQFWWDDMPKPTTFDGGGQ